MFSGYWMWSQLCKKLFEFGKDKGCSWLKISYSYQASEVAV